MNREYLCLLFFVSILQATVSINYQCSVCPIGKFKSVTSNNECVNCKENTYQDVLGATSPTQCKPCPSNSYAPAGSGRNTDCVCGLGYSGDAANYSTGSQNLNLQRSCGATLTDACETLHSSTGTLASSHAVDLDIGTYSLTSGSIEGEPLHFGMTRPWWRVTFERQAIVQTLEIYNDDDLKMSGLSIRVGNVDDHALMEQNALCAENVAWPVGDVLRVTCTEALQGRYLYIINGAETLMLMNNVQVTGYLLPPSEVCAACIPGKYKTTNGTVTCTDCAAGTASGTLAAVSVSACVTCAQNTYAGAGAPACTACPADSSTNATGSESVSLCKCNPGFSPEPSGDGCEACPPGTYKESDEDTECLNCVAGKYRAFPAATVPTDCLECPANTFSLIRSVQLTNCRCNAGYSEAEDGVACVACVAGTYKTLPGVGNCTNCEANEYSTTVAQVESTCSSCPSFSQAPPGSDEASDCACNAGYTGANGAECLACDQGTYKPTVGPDACTLCGNNTYSSDVAASSSSVCLPCQANSTSRMGSTRHSDCHCLKGFLTKDLGAPNATCEICSAGSFNAQLGATTCSICGAGYESSTPGAVSEEQCTECAEDTYSAAGAAQCDICPSNTFAPGKSVRLSDCKCLAGYHSQVTGQDGLPCSACQAGKHKELPGALPCTDCLQNTYSTETAATSNATCISCSANAVSMAGSSNASMCLCDFGYTGSNDAGCDACIAGKFKASIGSALCTDCPANTYSGLAAQTSNDTCVPCYDNSVSPAGSDEIDDCSCAAGFEFS